MTTNRHIARGISKETGRFLFGYPVRYGNQWFIIELTSLKHGYLGNTRNGDFGHAVYEITQEPDQFHGEFNGIKYWENDKVTYTHYKNTNYTDPDHLKNIIFEKKDAKIFTSFIDSDGKVPCPTGEDYKSIEYLHSENYRFKIIGNTHIKEEGSDGE